MATFRPVGTSLDIQQVFASEDGKHYRGYRQDLDPVIRKVEHLRQKVNEAPRSENPNQWKHVGSIPMTVLVDWLMKNKFTIDQFARNDGGIKGKTYPESTSGVKDKFLKYFLSREFSKLHNSHITTKRESSQFVVPSTLRTKP